jgi:hypothetical protein
VSHKGGVDDLKKEELFSFNQDLNSGLSSP